MPNHSKAELDRGVDNVYRHIIAIYSLKGALIVTKGVRLKLKAERKRRLKMKPSERAGVDEIETAIIKTKKDKTKKIKKKKGPGLFAALCKLFDKKGINKVTYQQAKDCAKEAKPDSNLSHGHFKWYKKKYKER